MEEVDITFKLTVTVSTALPALWRVVQTAFTSELVIQRTWEVLEVSTKFVISNICQLRGTSRGALVFVCQFSEPTCFHRNNLSFIH